MASATASQLTEDSCCAYCLQRLPYMVDPRQLPCSHVFCLSCLKADSAEISATRCRICGKTHEIEDLDTLAVADDTTTREDQSTKLLTKVLCDVCTGHRSISTTYCCDCKKHYCEEHHKLHSRMLGTTHVMIANNPEDSAVSSCRTHTEEALTLACSVCHNTFCVSCDTESGCVSSKDKTAAHNVVNLDELAQQLRVRIKMGLRKFAGNITEACKVEKSVLSSMDDVETKVEEMKQEVDRAAKQKMNAIQHRSEEMKDDLDKYLDEVSKETEKHSSHLMSKIDHCQNLWRSMNQMGQAADSDVLQKHKLFEEVLQQGSNGALRKRKYPETTLTAIGDIKMMRNPLVNHSVCPASAEFIKMCEGTFHCVYWTNDGTLVAGGTTLTHFARNLVELKSCSMGNELVTSVSQLYYNENTLVGSGIPNYIVHVRSEVSPRNNSFGCSKEYEHCAYAYSSSLTNEKFLFRNFSFDYSYPSAYAHYYPQLVTHLPSSHIVVAAPHVPLTVYSAEGSKLFTSSKTPQYLHCLPDGAILGTFPSQNKVVKYFLDIAAQTFTNIWEYQNVRQPAGISSDSGGYIYIGSESSSDIYILSPSGMLQKTISLARSGISKVTDIAVSGTRLAVSCEDKGLFLFELYREQPSKFDLDQYINENKL